MAAPYPCFMLSDPWRPDQLASSLDGSWCLVADAPRRVRRCYLDTSDRRLAAHGGILLAKRSGQVLGLIFEELASGKPMASRRAGDLPAQVGDIPPGMLRDMLLPMADTQPLQVMARVDGEIGVWRVMQGGDTVARLLVESGQCRRGEHGRAYILAPRITLVPVRGHDGPRDALMAWLAGEPRLTPCRGTRLAQALATLEQAAD